ncbi:MAG TPA: hypothetical protein VJS13_00795 [Pyrinomonadaceae bacterium]|nr:hypothetical protein [Pyrinomonadaceae bacterium]
MTKPIRKRNLRLAVSVTFFIVANSLTAEAYCILPDVADSFDRARAVFIGEVEEITPPRSNSHEGPFLDRAHLVEFKIERSWKGMPFGYLKVWVLLGGYEPTLTSISKGERYVVYAQPNIENGEVTNDLVVGTCNRTVLLPKNEETPSSFVFDMSRNGARDVRALDGLLVLKRR